ncbi:hypothetical protein IWQ56_003450 [Coemansia nantahalensis]|uniref:Uncharacterized protein n=1 Tax=Coemansia nantahalensis TaxID=2789366 RepID=A0ACC1K6H1_9FUNG|nr:hypothetical protein IWQ56_003450 [Coemansia nantahalensis]KAJ2774223.1 hypothetical protein IWQ57_000923 [Coemansia nantahalensis]
MVVELPALKTVALQLHKPGVLVMAFNRPKSLNALDPAVYEEWREVLRVVHANSAVRVLVITGNGTAFTAGHDLASFGRMWNSSAKEELRARLDVTRELTRLIITSPVPIIAAVNGPAVGFGCTVLGLCDLVLAAETAVFRTPFMELAFCAEGCSSVTFPRILGPAVANDMLLFGRSIGAAEMHQRGFVARLAKRDDLLPLALGIASKIAGQSQEAVRVTRGLIRRQDAIDELVRANDAEMDQLFLRMVSEDARLAVSKMVELLQSRSGGAKPKI